MTSDREPMDQDVETLLASARVIDAPAEMKARVRARLAASLPPLPGGGGGEAPAPNDVTSGAATALPASSFPAWSLVAVALVSGAAGFGLAVTVRGAPVVQERIVYIDRPPPTSVSTQEDVPSTRSTPSMQNAPPGLSVGDLPRVLPSGARTATSASSSSGPDLAKEREVLDVARAALGRADGAAALTAVAEHERKFERAVLREEREAIAIQALALLHRDAEAGSRADRFRKQFPQSLLLPAVEAAVNTKR